MSISSFSIYLCTMWSFPPVFLFCLINALYPAKGSEESNEGCSTQTSLTCAEYERKLTDASGDGSKVFKIAPQNDNAQCYFLVAVRKEYSLAQEVCQVGQGEDGGILAVPVTEHVFEMLMRSVHSILNSDQLKAVTGFWIGLRKSAGSWYWVCPPALGDMVVTRALQWTSAGSPQAKHAIIPLYLHSDNSKKNIKQVEGINETQANFFFCQLSMRVRVIRQAVNSSNLNNISTTVSTTIDETTEDSSNASIGNGSATVLPTEEAFHWDDICIDKTKECYIMFVGWLLACICILIIIIITVFLISARARVNEAQRHLEDTRALVENVIAPKGGGGSVRSSRRGPGGSVTATKSSLGGSLRSK